MFDVYTTIFIAFIAIVALLLFIYRKNMKREGISILWRTTKGTAFLTWLGKKFSRIWWVYGTLAIIIGFYYSIYFTVDIFSVIFYAFTSQTTPAVGGLVLPVPGEDAMALPGVIGVPIISWLITIFILLVVHEGSHAVMAVREGVRIKSVGLGMFAVLPVAFMEPDEKELKKQKPMKQMRVYASGSMGNFIVAILFSSLLVFTIPSFYELSPGVRFSGYMEGFPAQEANLTGVIVEIDGVAIDNAQNLSDYLNEVGSGKRITITTLVPDSDGEDETATFSLVTAENPNGGDGGFIGITNLYSNAEIRDGVHPEVAKFLYGKDPFGSNIGLYGLLFWIAVINFAIGMLNMLPAFPLDGGAMWKLVLDRITPKNSMTIMMASSMFVWAMIALMIGFSAFGGGKLF